MRTISPRRISTAACALLWLSTTTLGGCKKAPDAATAPPRATSDTSLRLEAKVTSPTDVWLSWTDLGAGKVAGYVVEYASPPGGEYVALEFAPPSTTTHHHADLQAGTTFTYRVRPFYGPASSPVEIALPSTLSDDDFAARFEKDEDFDWSHPETRPEGNATRGRIRESNPGAQAEAAPSDLVGKLMPITVSGFLLTWTDRASDEEGYFIEQQLDGGGDFRVVAVTAKNINKIGYALKLGQRKSFFRVRAYYYGPPSNVEVRQTAPEQT
jgi:hypothetical protein